MKKQLKLSEITKSEFGCCAWWKACDMGRKACYHEKEDPERSDSCLCYQTHHQKKVEVIVSEQPAMSFDESGQGCLF